MKDELKDATGELSQVRTEIEALRQQVSRATDAIDRRARQSRVLIAAVAFVALLLVGMLWQQQRAINTSVGFLCAQIEARDTGIARLMEEEAQPTPYRESLIEFLRRDPCPRR